MKEFGLFSGSDIKLTKTDVMPFVKNLEMLIFQIEVSASEIDLATLKKQRCNFLHEGCQRFLLI